MLNSFFSTTLSNFFNTPSRVLAAVVRFTMTMKLSAIKILVKVISGCRDVDSLRHFIPSRLTPLSGLDFRTKASWARVLAQMSFSKGFAHRIQISSQGAALV